jgi:hypothetical protein
MNITPTLYGGTTETMKEIIGRGLGRPPRPGPSRSPYGAAARDLATLNR